MKKERKPKHFVQAPGYPGGPQAMRKFIRENLRYPRKAFDEKIEGTVVVKFDLDQNGKVFKTSIKHGLGHGCDEEAMRVVKLLKFNPTKNRKVRVTFHKTININFYLKNIIPKPAGNIHYEFKEAEAKEKKTATYNYTITME